MFVLQTVPVLGFLLSLIGAPFFTGLLIHAALALMIVEAAWKKAWRAIALIPLFVYGSYYVEYSSDGPAIKAAKARLWEQNARFALVFDNSEMSLVTPNASGFVASYDIPVAFEANTASSEGYFSYRLIPRAQCDAIPNDPQGPVQTSPAHFDGRPRTDVCLLRMAEKPPHRTVAVGGTDTFSRWNAGPGIWGHDVWFAAPRVREHSVDILVDGTIAGSFKTATARRLPPFPVFFVGCSHELRGREECGAALWRQSETLDTTPESLGARRYDDPVAIMLHIERRTGESFQKLAGREEAVRFLREAQEKQAKFEARNAAKAKRREDAFLTLEDLLEGESFEPPQDFVATLARDPKRLAQYAPAMAARFDEMLRQKRAKLRAYWDHNGETQSKALAFALAALPEDAFLPLAANLAGGVAKVGWFQPPDYTEYPALWMRLGDLDSDAAFEYYKENYLDDYFKTRTISTVALCRMGRSDQKLIDEMKRRVDNYFLYDIKPLKYPPTPEKMRERTNYISSLFVALLRFGEEKYLRTKTAADATKDWRDAILAGKGKTARGPNNCMPMEWNGEVPLTMAPALVCAANGDWAERRASR